MKRRSCHCEEPRRRRGDEAISTLGCVAPRCAETRSFAGRLLRSSAFALRASAGLARNDRWGILALLLCLGLLPSLLGAPPAPGPKAHGQSRSDAGLRVVVEEQWVAVPPYAYQPIRVRIRNDLPRKRNLLCICKTFRLQSPIEIRKEIEIGRGEEVRFTLLVPAASGSGLTQLWFWEDGSQRTDLHFPLSLPGWSGTSSSQPETLSGIVLFDRGDPDTRALAKAQEEVISPWLTSGGFHSPSYLAVLDPDSAPGQWQAFYALSAVGIRGDAWESLPESSRTAILDWVRVGGTLWFYEGPGADAATVAKVLFQGKTPPQNFMPLDPEHYRLGLGRISWISDDPFPLFDSDRWKKEISWAQQSSSGGEAGALKAILSTKQEIPGIGKVPVGIFLLLIVVFTILIGPVNYVALRKAGKVHLFLVTVPALSLVSVLALVSYSAISEGFGIRGIVRSLTWLDPVTQEATVVSRTEVYAALSPRGGLRFSPGVYVSAQQGQEEEMLRDLSSYYLPKGPAPAPRRVDWTSEQHLQEGWLPARTLTSVGTIAFSTWRAGIEWDPDEGELTNGFGETIEMGWLCAKRGQTLHVEKVRPGDRVKAGEVNAQSVSTWLSGAAPWALSLLPLKEREYLLALDSNPQVPSGGLEFAEQKSVYLVKGTLAGQGH